MRLEIVKTVLLVILAGYSVGQLLERHPIEAVCVEYRAEWRSPDVRCVKYEGWRSR